MGGRAAPSPSPSGLGSAHFPSETRTVVRLHELKIDNFTANWCEIAVQSASSAMPESGEVRLFVELFRQALGDGRITKLKVLDGRYLTREIRVRGAKGRKEWISSITNPKSGRQNTISAKYISDHNIADDDIRFVCSLENLDEFNTEVKHLQPTIHLRGKFCWIEFRELSDDEDDDDSEVIWSVAITFGMSGAFYTDDTTSGNTPHLKFSIRGGDEKCVYFTDPRRFGTVVIARGMGTIPAKIKALAHDILNDDPLDCDEIIERFRRYDSQNVCKVLMNQKAAVAGIGNYIKSETLYACRISPLCTISDLSDDKIYKMYQRSRKIAKNAYQTRPGYQTDGFKTTLKVYRKTHDPEGRSVETLETPDGRTTYYVPDVQV